MSDQHPLNLHFDPKTIERGLYAQWEEQGYFAPKGDGEPFSIAIPPPNVTGSLHVGHAFQMTVMDVLTRYHRMTGRRTLWQTGTDHAGISTQMAVAERLRARGIDITDLDRAEFVDTAWAWKREFGGAITQQLRRLGASVDWSRERFTMDEGFSRAVLEVFVRLYDEGLIYKGKRLVNWDPKLETTLSDLEVISTEEDGMLWHIRYPLLGARTTQTGLRYVVVATTRPETMLGDTAVAVNPADERFQDLIGAEVQLPLVERAIPVIGDTHVDPEFGSGCLKITPAHDFDDYEIGQRHQLDMVNIFTSDAKLSDAVPLAYRGLDRFAAREQVLADLDARQLIDAREDYKVQIPRGERTGVVVEPWLTDQWFVKVQSLADRAIKAVEDREITFEPERWQNVYFAWMRDIKDWAISRQLWWGHQIPAWYDSDGQVYVARSEDEARAKYEIAAAVPLRRDEDVLDTWFSSALWTFGTLGWPEGTDDLKAFHPTDVLVTGHDIIFFWVARMIMMTLHFTDEIPFRKVFIHGLVRDAEGQKMSKTKGNGLDPLDLIDGIGVEALVQKRTQDLTQASLAARIERNTRKDYPNGIPAYGTDAVRFTFCAMASPGSNYNLDLSRVEGYHYFCNKLWNATKFVLGNLTAAANEKPTSLSVEDLWIRSKLNKLIANCHYAMRTYRFDLYAHHVYQFAWHDFCDWYLEFTKTRLFDGALSDDDRIAVESTLLFVMQKLIRLLHPIMPFLTESLYQQLPQAEDAARSIMLEQYPAEADSERDDAAETTVQWLQEVIVAIRNIRGERSISPRHEIDVHFSEGTRDDKSRVERTATLIRRLARVGSIGWLDSAKDVFVGSTRLIEDLKIHVPFKDEQEVERERVRVEKVLTRLQADLQRCEKKLGNTQFLQRAPADVVTTEKRKQVDLKSQMDTMRSHLENLARAFA